MERRVSIVDHVKTSVGCGVWGNVWNICVYNVQYGVSDVVCGGQKRIVWESWRVTC